MAQNTAAGQTAAATISNESKTTFPSTISTTSTTPTTTTLTDDMASLTLGTRMGSGSSLEEEVTRSVMHVLTPNAVAPSAVRGGNVPSQWFNDHPSPSPLPNGYGGHGGKVDPPSIAPTKYLGQLRPIGLEAVTSPISSPLSSPSSPIDLAPPFIEKYTSFVSSLDGRMIMDSVTSSLTKLGSDYRVATGKYKVSLICPLLFLILIYLFIILLIHSMIGWGSYCYSG
jgi:hypothetical protein